jgi:hypothetical protein
MVAAFFNFTDLTDFLALWCEEGRISTSPRVLKFSQDEIAVFPSSGALGTGECDACRAVSWLLRSIFPA